MKYVEKEKYLVASSSVLTVLLSPDSTGNVWRLLVQRHHHRHRLVIQPLAAVIVPDLLDSIADNLLVVNLGLKRHNQAQKYFLVC